MISSRRINRRDLLGGAAALAAASFGTKALAQSARSATIAYGSTGYTWALAFLAEGIGAWKNQGIDISAVDFPTGRESLQALLGGSAQFATSTDTPVVFAALQGLRPLVVASYSRYTRDMMIVMRNGSGATANDPASLKARRIATRVGTSGQYMLSRYLTMAGLTDSDVTIVDLSPADMASATLRGDVDGFSWTSQAAALALEVGQDQLFAMTQDGLEKFFRSHQLLLTNEDTLSNDPELVTGGLKALIEAETYMAEHLDWASVIAPRVRAEPEFIKDMTSIFEFKVTFDEAFVQDIVVQMEWAIAAGHAQRPERPLEEIARDLIREQPLSSIDAARVKL